MRAGGRLIVVIQWSQYLELKGKGSGFKHSIYQLFSFPLFHTIYQHCFLSFHREMIQKTLVSCRKSFYVYCACMLNLQTTHCLLTKNTTSFKIQKSSLPLHFSLETVAELRAPGFQTALTLHDSDADPVSWMFI